MGPCDYALLELIDRLGGVQGRKRLQKLAFIAKLAGMPLDESFFFHYYGPYSGGLASRVDQLVDRKQLDENARTLATVDGVEYGYQLTDVAREFLAQARKRVPDDFAKALERGISRAAALKDREVFELELASTLLFWLERGHSREEAESITKQRKNVGSESVAFAEARTIADEIWGVRNSSEK